MFKNWEIEKHFMGYIWKHKSRSYHQEKSLRNPKIVQNVNSTDGTFKGCSATTSQTFANPEDMCCGECEW